MASNVEVIKRLDVLEKEVLSSRTINTEEHQKIYMTAEDIQKLTSQIDVVLENFKGFSATIRFVKNVLIVVAAIYLVFKDPIHAAIGG